MPVKINNPNFHENCTYTNWCQNSQWIEKHWWLLHRIFNETASACDLEKPADGMMSTAPSCVECVATGDAVLTMERVSWDAGMFLPFEVEIFFFVFFFSLSVVLLTSFELRWHLHIRKCRKCGPYMVTRSALSWPFASEFPEPFSASRWTQTSPLS